LFQFGRETMNWKGLKVRFTYRCAYIHNYFHLKDLWNRECLWFFSSKSTMVNLYWNRKFSSQSSATSTRISIIIESIS